MIRSVIAVGVVVAAVGLPDSPAMAAACNDDGLARLCVSSLPSGDAVALNYTVTQEDGPGTYAISTVDAAGTVSPTQAVGPLAFGATARGTLYRAIGRCYQVQLTSTAGSSNVVGQVCG